MSKRLRRAWGLAVALAGGLAAGGALANDLALTNVTLKPRDDATAFVQFDLRWENSWLFTNINHDAAWVFFKIKPEGQAAWEHVILETNGHVAGTGTEVEIIVPPDRVGCFIRRAEEGYGALSVSTVKLAWDFSSHGLVKTDRVRIQAFAVEMVYVASGPFQVGSGGTEARRFYAGGTENDPFQIDSEAALTLGDTDGALWAKAGIVAGTGSLPEAFPKGYNAFYCMKYELTQGQYRDFLNSLTRAQQITRTRSQNGNDFVMSGKAAYTSRNGLRCPTSVPLAPLPIVFGCDASDNRIFNETNDAIDRACNYLTWSDQAAFADWAGLRPMSELEFEKACRGPLTPVADEYAWGDATVTWSTAGLSFDGTGQERAKNGNCCGPSGPYRVGIYATSDSTRNTAGASYWGAMELTGNVWDRAVTLDNATWHLFTGLHGDGQLTVQGNANVAFWPNLADNSGMSCYRGGGISDSGYPEYMRVSSRLYYHTNTTIENDGGRMVRTAP